MAKASFEDTPHNDPQLRRWMIVGSALMSVVFVWSVRSDRVAMAWIVALQLGRTVFNAQIVRRMKQTWRTDLHLLAGAVNILATIVVSHIARWQLPVLLCIPFQAAIMSGYGAAWRRPIAAAHVVAVSVVALLDAVPFSTVVVAVGTAALVHGVIDARSLVLERAVRQVELDRGNIERAHEELAKAHALLVQRDRVTSLGLIAAGVAHEINNPMSFVTTNLEVLLEDLPRFADLSAETRHDYIHDLLPATYDGVQRVNAIVADLRRFAQGDMEQVVDFDLAREIGTAVRMCRNRFRDGVHLELSLDELPMVHGRPRQVCQVVLNLIVNAAQASPSGGVVGVKTQRVGEEVVISVSDRGAGIPEEARHHLFEPFFTTKKPGEGTGLGLSVVHGIVKAHGGKIDVDSTVGVGTMVRVTLPLRAERIRRGALGHWSTRPPA